MSRQPLLTGRTRLFALAWMVIGWIVVVLVLVESNWRLATGIALAVWGVGALLLGRRRRTLAMIRYGKRDG